MIQIDKKNISSIRMGLSNISKVYLGNEQVFPELPKIEIHFPESSADAPISFDYNDNSIRKYPAISPLIIKPKERIMSLYISINPTNPASAIIFNDVDLSALSKLDSLFKGIAVDYIDFGNLDFSNATSMRNFLQNSTVRKVDGNKIKSEKCVDFYYCFEACVNLQELDLSGLIVSNANCMNMFSGCSSLKKLLIPGLKVTKNKWFVRFLYKCDALEELDISGFDFDVVTSLGSSYGQEFWPSFQNLKILRTNSDFAYKLLFEEGAAEKVNMKDFINKIAAQEPGYDILVDGVSILE